MPDSIPRMSIGLVSLTITIASIIVAVSVAWATLSAQAGTLEQRVNANTAVIRSDHDCVTAINQRLASIDEKLSDIRADIKTLKSR